MNNRYETKMAVKEGACDLCYRATQSVLTCGPADFFFICKNHLLSPLFCKPEVDPSPPASSTPLPEKVEDEKKDSRDEASSKDAERANYTPAPELPPPRWYILDAKIYESRLMKKRQKSDDAKKLAMLSNMPSVPRQ